MSRATVIRGLQVILSVAIVVTAMVRYGPQNDAGELTSFIVPTHTPTVTRVTVQRLPTPTSYVPTATPPPLIHIVQKGDVLGLIADLYDTTEEELVKANNMKSSDDIIVIGQELIITGAQRTPAPLAYDTATPTPTPTSIYSYPAPALLSPANGAVFSGTDTHMMLQWSAVGVLAEGEWYEVQIWQSPQDPSHATRFRTRSTAWIVPASLLDAPRPAGLRWQVLVIYAGRTVLHRSPASEVRRIILE